ncbi:MAG TPA: glutamyl-tRNA reductase [Fimbriimonadaceae bacterium]
MAPEIPSSQFLSSFGVVGVSYKNADLEFRSGLSFTEETAQHFLSDVHERGIRECVVLSTCNRSEIYFIGGDSALIESSLAMFFGISPHHLPEHIYRKSGKDSIQHLFTVASGLDSAVLGETEILAQVKDAWNRSNALGLCGSRLQLALQRALMASKRVRTETKISKHVTSVSSLAVRSANRHLGGVAGRKATIAGAGHTAEKVAKELFILKPSSIAVANRTLENASLLALAHGGSAHGLGELDELVGGSDVVFLALGVDEPVLTKAKLSVVDHPLLVVDLCVPRACEESVSELPNVTLIHVDALEQECVENEGLRLAEVPKGEGIVLEELVLFAELCIAREASYTIQELQKLAERVRKDNLSSMSPRLESLSDEARALVEEIAMRVATGLLMNPIQKLRDPKLNLAHRTLIAEAFGITETPKDGE